MQDVEVIKQVISKNANSELYRSLEKKRQVIDKLFFNNDIKFIIEKMDSHKYCAIRADIVLEKIFAYKRFDVLDTFIDKIKIKYRGCCKSMLDNIETPHRKEYLETTPSDYLVDLLKLQQYRLIYKLLQALFVCDWLYEPEKQKVFGEMTQNSRRIINEKIIALLNKADEIVNSSFIRSEIFNFTEKFSPPFVKDNVDISKILKSESYKKMPEKKCCSFFIFTFLKSSLCLKDVAKPISCKSINNDVVSCISNYLNCVNY